MSTSTDQTDPFILNLAGEQPVTQQQESSPSLLAFAVDHWLQKFYRYYLEKEAERPVALNLLLEDTQDILDEVSARSIPHLVRMYQEVNAVSSRTHGQIAAMADVLAERDRQDAKWGEQNHDPVLWSAVLTEEVGEFTKAALHHRFGGPEAAGLREEAVQVAAVALAIIECLDRNKSSAQETISGLDEPPERCQCGAKYDHCDDSRQNDDTFLSEYVCTGDCDGGYSFLLARCPKCKEGRLNGDWCPHCNGEAWEVVPGSYTIYKPSA